MRTQFIRATASSSFNCHFGARLPGFSAVKMRATVHTFVCSLPNVRPSSRLMFIVIIRSVVIEHGHRCSQCENVRIRLWCAIACSKRCVHTPDEWCCQVHGYDEHECVLCGCMCVCWPHGNHVFVHNMIATVAGLLVHSLYFISVLWRIRSSVYTRTFSCDRESQFPNNNSCRQLNSASPWLGFGSLSGCRQYSSRLTNS